MAKVGGKKPIPISNSDLKKAIVKRNNSLKLQNENLSVSIKVQEKELKSLEKQHVSGSKGLGKLLKDITFQEERMQKLKGGVYSNEKLLSGKIKKVEKAEEELCEYEDTVEKLEDKERKLLDEIARLEFYKAKCVESKNELAGIQEKKDVAESQFDSIKADIEQLYVDHNSKILSCEGEYNALEKKAKSHEDMVYRFEQRLFETEDQFKVEDSKLKDILAKSEEEKKKAGDELQAVENLVNNKEDEYIKWEQKVNKISAKADKEQDRIKKSKESYEKWRIGVLEEVARLKLKNKVENIDKAGLSEILNG